MKRRQIIYENQVKEDAGFDIANSIIVELGDHALTKSHARHISFERSMQIGLKVSLLEEDNDLQDSVLSVHHAFIHTLSSTGAYKIIENHQGVAFIQMMKQVIMQ